MTRKAYLKKWYKENRLIKIKETLEYLKNNPECVALANAKQRCTNPKNPMYQFYGAKGIKYLIPNTKSLLARIGKRPSNKYSIDRINTLGHYELSNVRWATIKQQKANSNRNNQHTKGRINYGTDSH